MHVLDAFVKTALDEDPALLAGWNTVKRVQKVPARSFAPTSSVAGDESKISAPEGAVVPLPVLTAAYLQNG